jgi:hypothetical protein
VTGLPVTFLGEKGRRHTAGRRAAAQWRSNQEVGSDNDLMRLKEEMVGLGRVGCLA